MCARVRLCECVCVRACVCACVRVCGQYKGTELNKNRIRTRELCESRGGRPGLPVPKSPQYGPCGRIKQH